MRLAIIAFALAAALGFVCVAARAQPTDSACARMTTLLPGEDQDQKARACIDDLSKRITAAANVDKAKLLAQRAQQYHGLGELDAAWSDYTQALALTPDDGEIRLSRARLALQMNRGQDALDDVAKLLDQEPHRLQYLALKGYALSTLKREQEAITVYSNAIALAQSCAEASIVQHKINELRHAFDPPPTKEQMLKQLEDRSYPPLYAIPEPSVMNLGFACTPTDANTFEDLVLMKQVLYSARGSSYRAIGNTEAARNDYRYAVSLSQFPELESLELCLLEVETNDDWSAVEHCRLTFDLNTIPILSDPARAAKVGEFLLNDGDLKGACRIAFPFMPDNRMRPYLGSEPIKALQKRVKLAMDALQMTDCGIDYSRRWRTPSALPR
ncbi:MAG: hypothetical protein GC190_05840 [Alphaproteobacteria bacterium]|nr:hypothetical protein [Alphaproteobacteria bacterium]